MESRSIAVAAVLLLALVAGAVAKNGKPHYQHHSAYNHSPAPKHHHYPHTAHSKPHYAKHGHHSSSYGKKPADYDKPLPCQATESCIPTVKAYNNLAPEGPVEFAQWPQCDGPFVLCSVANCSIIASSGTEKVPLQAECGCLLPERADYVKGGKSYVTPNIIKSKQVYEATIDECFDGQDPSTVNSTCTEVNSAPVCKDINARKMYGGIWPLISTFTPYADQGVQKCTGAADNSSIVADCMTAACYKKEAFDGSPYVCYCPVYSVPAGSTYALGYPRAKNANGIACQQPEGYVVSGA